MITVPIILNEKNALNRKAEPITMGVPFAKSKLTVIDRLALFYLDEIIPCQIKTTAKWNDGSIKWILLEFQIDLVKNHEKHLILTEQDDINNTHIS